MRISSSLRCAKFPFGGNQPIIPASERKNKQQQGVVVGSSTTVSAPWGKAEGSPGRRGRRADRLAAQHRSGARRGQVRRTRGPGKGVFGIAHRIWTNGGSISFN